MTPSGVSDVPGGDERSPLVTVVTCVYNGGKWLRPAILSIVNQSYRNLEIMVVDDGSTDGCIETITGIRDDRIRILHQENRGKPSAMNRALDEMRGEFFAIQDADDISHQRRIERQLEPFLRNPELAGVFCGYELILHGRHIAPTFAYRDIDECSRRIVEFGMPGHDATVMFRTASTKGLRYEPSLPLGEGHDFILRVGEVAPMMVIGECLLSYRIHANMITQREGSREAELTAEVVRRACARRGCEVPVRRTRQCRLHGIHKLNSLVAHFMESVVNLRETEHSWQALHVAFTCWRLQPFVLRFFRPLVYAITPLRLIEIHRSRKADGRASVRKLRSAATEPGGD